MNTNFHKSLFLFLLTALVSCFGITQKAHAELLGTWSYTQNFFWAGPPVQTINPTYWFGPDPLQPFPTDYNLFESVSLNSADVGMTWSATALDDPDFGGVANILTDDLLSSVALTMVDVANGGGQNVSASDAFWFHGFSGNPDNMPVRDFAGSTIDAFTLTLDDFVLTQQGAFNVSTFTFTFSVLGTVPAPGPLSLLALSACLTRRRRKRN